MRFHLIILSILFVTGVSWSQSSTSTGKLFRINNVEFLSRDGFPLQATMYRTSEKSPGILLFHVMGVGQRFDYENLAIRLSMQGFNVLAVDLRGHGESLSEQSFEYTNETLADDEDAALQFLINQANVEAEQIGVIGASGTVAEAIGLASRHHEVKAIVGLSGHTDAAGAEFLSKATYLSVLGVGATSDSIMTKVAGNWQLQTSAETMQKVVAHSNHHQSLLVVYAEAPHGTAMLHAKADLIPTLTTWLTQVLMAEL